MTEEIEFIRGSGNVFRDFGRPNADAEQLRCILAARIIGILDGAEMSIRGAEEKTGVKASEFSRIRNAKLRRFTIDRLITIINKLGHEVDVQVDLRPATAHAAE
jgi:Uncharacterized conserved small protein